MRPWWGRNVKRLFAVAILAVVLVTIASAGWTSTYVKRFGTTTTTNMAAGAIDTVWFVGEQITGIRYMSFALRADTVNTALANFLWLPSYHKVGDVAGTYTNLAFGIGAGANDSTLPLDGWAAWDTITTGGLLPYYTTVWDTLRIIVTGKRSGQNSKACSIKLRTMKP